MNQLKHETSPYLLQHAHNPVHWHAWKPEAFARARAEDKPILVSIGYSTCHWCHVMERESFENEEVAAFMNAHFVNIKVDREERPDVDHIYMEACQILTGGGGWPLNCFLTPEGKPFYAGTYFPPQPAHQRPSWMQLLEHLAGIWQNRREVAEEQAEKLLGHIRRNDDVFVKKIGPSETPGFSEGQNSSPEKKIGPAETPGFSEGQNFPGPGNISGPENPPGFFTTELLENIFYRVRDSFDRVEGGFGGAPKFPSTMAIRFLLNHFYFTANREALEQALLSLDKMAMGGIYDQIGGGFSRYSTDREWLVPHFEKMLYDNALLVGVLADAFKLTQKPLYRETIEETLAYVRREMTSPEGGFYSAQDADSEGVEGKFFVWDKAEIEEVLGEDAAVFCAFYNVSDHGNWEEKNILHREKTFGEFAGARGLEVGFFKKKMQVCREALFRVRDWRVHPGLDDKILLGWNALMTSAYAAAFAALGHPEYRAAAVRNLDFLLEKFPGGFEGQFFHTWKAGKAQYNAFLEDYAFLIAALTDVYQITFEPRHLALAGKLTEHVLENFQDTESGLFFFTSKGQTDVVIRRKDLFDNATPSGNSTMALNLQRLGILLARRDWRETAVNMLLSMRETVERYPLSFERWAAAIQNEAHPMPEIAVVGGNALEKAAAINARFLPNGVIAASTVETAELPLLAGKTGGAAAQIYVCRDFACQRPVENLEELENDLFITVP